MLKPLSFELSEQHLAPTPRNLPRRETVFHEVERRVRKGRDRAVLFIEEAGKELINELMNPVARCCLPLDLLFAVAGERPQGPLRADIAARLKIKNALLHPF